MYRIGRRGTIYMGYGRFQVDFRSGVAVVAAADHAVS